MLVEMNGHKSAGKHSCHLNIWYFYITDQKAKDAGILQAPYTHREVQKGKSALMVNKWANYQRQSYLSEGMQAVFIPTLDDKSGKCHC